MVESKDIDRRGRRISAWSRSSAWRAIGRAAITTWNAKRDEHARCGAHRKYDGQPCQLLATRNGRCRFHGGRTPTGAGYHLPRWPNADAPDADQKLSRKLKQLGRSARARAERLAQMSADERDAHARWQRAHTPGPPGPRAAARERRKQNVAARELLQREPSAPAPAADQHEVELRRLRARAAVLEAEARKEGIFG